MLAEGSGAARALGLLADLGCSATASGATAGPHPGASPGQTPARPCGRYRIRSASRGLFSKSPLPIIRLAKFTRSTLAARLSARASLGTLNVREVFTDPPGCTSTLKGIAEGSATGRKRRLSPSMRYTDAPRVLRVPCLARLERRAAKR